ncbi:secretion system protein [Virgisporangium aliadipatigenens]|uniref:Secretion system protein n=1 Tax=Virgisporangium aliadipatigenens TaxID=741659 RepID=A0A8J3YW21_9ACTN|nr:type II secretion system F family protein [Virgisporangium aliadipatigenens]GIJ50855.1 secretion system protein [Virgisporangium aliadipatigenens]
MTPVLLAVGVACLFSAVVILVPLLSRAAVRRRAVLRRLRQLDAFDAVAEYRRSAVIAGEARRHGPFALVDRLLGESRRTALAASLERAGIALGPAEWVVTRCAAALSGAFVLMLAGPWWFGLPAGLVGGWVGTNQYRRARAEKRSARFADLLPDALQLVVSALRSGFSLAQAIDAVVREGPEPINTEFGRAQAETRLGGELEDALERTAARNGSRDLSWLVMAIRIQREVGGNLSEVLETANETMRERARLARHVRVLSAEGRLSAYLLCGLPVAVAGYMFISNPEYLRPLYTERGGLVMLTAGALSVAVGILWIRRLIRVRV